MTAGRYRPVGPVVIGSGVAGLSTALALDGCVVITSGALGTGGSSPLAQGGIAASIHGDDSAVRHGADTHAVACGLAVDEVVQAVTAGGPAAINRLVELGADFDRGSDGGLALGREAGHRARRIVHANGDATGAALMATLVEAVRARPDIEVIEHHDVVDLLLAGEGSPDRVGGVVTRSAAGEPAVLASSAVVLATGGYAHCFGRTTTPASVIGTGLAMAARAGVRLADLEFVQFHPTALDVDSASSLPLLTEALRGEGAVLVDVDGRRFMPDHHPDAELAPRDVVARAIYREVIEGRHPRLDCRQAIGETITSRFPTVFALASRHGFDPRREPLPVTPAAHYCMGGVATDEVGRTSLPGLWAVGEVASSGLHGANRLASNSLLEGLVLGRSVGSAITRSPSRPGSRLWCPSDPPGLLSEDPALAAELRALLWSAAGVERDEWRLRWGLDELAKLEAPARRELRTRTMHTVASLVIRAALDRTESRGAHCRLDAPWTDPAQAARSMVTPRRVAFEPRPASEAAELDTGLVVAS